MMALNTMYWSYTAIYRTRPGRAQGLRPTVLRRVPPLSPRSDTSSSARTGDAHGNYDIKVGILAHGRRAKRDLTSRPTRHRSPEAQLHASRNILQAIGGTSLVELRRVVPADCARIFVKVEGENPTGSMKDRVAVAMIAGAEQSGRLQSGSTVVEYTGGSTGASL